MAKYSVKHSCGHTVEVQLYGKGSERERKLEWLAEQDCPACEKAAAAAKHSAANAEAAEANAEAGLATLQGSDKQIAWAETIRAQFIPGLQAKLAEVQSKATEANADQVAGCVAMIQSIVDEQSASYWIDSRDLEKAEVLIMRKMRKS